jgi:hypothetical protein
VVKLELQIGKLKMIEKIKKIKTQTAEYKSSAIFMPGASQRLNDSVSRAYFFKELNGEPTTR